MSGLRLSVLAGRDSTSSFISIAVQVGTDWYFIVNPKQYGAIRCRLPGL